MDEEEGDEAEEEEDEVGAVEERKLDRREDEDEEELDRCRVGVNIDWWWRFLTPSTFVPIANPSASNPNSSIAWPEKEQEEPNPECEWEWEWEQEEEEEEADDEEVDMGWWVWRSNKVRPVKSDTRSRHSSPTAKKYPSPFSCLRWNIQRRLAEKKERNKNKNMEKRRIKKSEYEIRFNFISTNIRMHRRWLWTHAIKELNWICWCVLFFGFTVWQFLDPPIPTRKLAHLYSISETNFSNLFHDSKHWCSYYYHYWYCSLCSLR